MTPRIGLHVGNGRPDPDGSREKGSFTVFVAVLSLALFALFGLVIDGGRAVAAQSTATAEAEQAARIGAGQISVDAIRMGSPDIDPAAATAAAEQYLRAEGSAGSITVVGQTVIVHIQTEEPTVILGIVDVRRIGISAMASATNVHGVTRGDS